MDVHIHLGPVQSGAQTSEAQLRLNTATQMNRLAREALNQLEVRVEYLKPACGKGWVP